MISKWQWTILRIARQLWFRPALFALIGLLTALFSIFFSPNLPVSFGGKIGADSVDSILNIIASSMLAVTTFSLSTMVSAYGASANNVTPRATSLVVEDSTTQNVLATFIGSFLFSLVGIVALSTGAFGEKGRTILFVVTLCVIGIIVLTLLRWIGHLSRLGRMSDTIDRVEDRTRASLRARAELPCLGAIAAESTSAIPEGTAVFSSSVGYLQHLDVGRLDAVARRQDATIVVLAVPGAFVDLHRPLAATKSANDSTIEEIRACFTIGLRRSFDQDPRFGLSVLAEIASRALSPAINDAGTAIDVIGRAVRLLSDYAVARGKSSPELLYKNLRVPPLAISDLFDDVFHPIARDGAAIVEVQIRLQKALAALAEFQDEFAAAAQRQSQLALQRTNVALSIAEEREILRDLALAGR